MPRFLYGDDGRRYFETDDGQIVPAPEGKGGVFEQAGRQLQDLAGGLQTLQGQGERARLAAAARNREFAGADYESPIKSLVGQALPGMATFPITGGAGWLPQLATNIAIGAGETALDVGEGGSMGQRAIAGGIGGALGDIGGRAMGRIFNAAKGLAQDIRLGRAVAQNPVAREAEGMGLEVMGSQRMTPGSQESQTLQRLEQGEEASLFSRGLGAGMAERNQGAYNGAALRAIGLDPAAYGRLGPSVLREANTRLSDGFGDVAAVAADQGPLQIPNDLAMRIMNTRGQIPALRNRGRFQGLSEAGESVLSGNEWNIARRALASDAANAAAKGEYELADDIFADVELLDQLLESKVGPEVGEQFARLREQYRVLKILQKQGVIKSDGEISPRNLNRALNAGTGFGTTAKQGLNTVNPESKDLIDMMRVAATPELQRMQSSQTAERLAAGRVAGMVLDPTDWLSLAGEVALPATVGATSTRGGRAVTGALTPAAPPARAAGRAVGRGMLDELLYPFVGIEDERPLQ